MNEILGRGSGAASTILEALTVGRGSAEDASEASVYAMLNHVSRGVLLNPGRIWSLGSALRDLGLRWSRIQARREALAIVERPYGEPPFPLTHDQWAELCRYEAERTPGASAE